jgi:hypothetical protein
MINKSEISNQKSFIKNMEVHHHPNVEKKNFKEYFLEFLMIFLAVTMGFFAESLREHISEKRIEKEYIQSFVSDLKKDTAAFNEVIPLHQTFITGLDTMLNILSQPPYNDSAIRLLYYLSRRYTMSITPMSYTLRTITQLKNAGGLRLITNKQASDSIVSYNKIADDNINLFNITEHDFMIPSIKAGNKIFNPKFMLPYNNGNDAVSLLLSHEKISLLTNDETTLAEYTNLIYDVKQIRLNYSGQLKWNKERAEDMIQFFEQEYHLEKVNGE